MRKYKKNPITEALIDIHIDPMLSVGPSIIEQFHEVFQSDFPEKRPRYKIGSILQADLSTKEVQHKDEVNIQGFQFWKTDKKEVIQSRLDGFSYSRLAPYDCWEVHSSPMFDAWRKYVTKFNPLKIKRVAVRFINVFKIPMHQFKLEDYFTSYPKYPEGFSKSQDGDFLQRLVIDDHSGPKTILTFTTIRPTDPNIIPILLDIDTYQEINYDISGQGIEDKLNELHLFVEKVFEICITDKIRELIA